jgi:hypothetical protein
MAAAEAPQDRAPDTAFQTLTMARVYAAQERWPQAAAVCRHLLTLDPDDPQAAELLAAAQRSMHAAGVLRLAPLAAQWAALTVRLRGLRWLAALHGPPDLRG